MASGTVRADRMAPGTDLHIAQGPKRTKVSAGLMFLTGCAVLMLSAWQLGPPFDARCSDEYHWPTS